MWTSQVSNDPSLLRTRKHLIQIFCFCKLAKETRKHARWAIFLSSLWEGSVIINASGWIREFPVRGKSVKERGRSCSVETRTVLILANSIFRSAHLGYSKNIKAGNGSPIRVLPKVVLSTTKQKLVLLAPNWYFPAWYNCLMKCRKAHR